MFPSGIQMSDYMCFELFEYEIRIPVLRYCSVIDNYNVQRRNSKLNET